MGASEDPTLSITWQYNLNDSEFRNVWPQGIGAGTVGLYYREVNGNKTDGDFIPSATKLQVGHRQYWSWGTQSQLEETAWERWILAQCVYQIWGVRSYNVRWLLIQSSLTKLIITWKNVLWLLKSSYSGIPYLFVFHGFRIIPSIEYGI